MNPARSLAPALFVRGWALSQVWVFLVFPLVGGVIGGLIYRFVLEAPRATENKIVGPGEATE